MSRARRLKSRLGSIAIDGRHRDAEVALDISLAGVGIDNPGQEVGCETEIFECVHHAPTAAERWIMRDDRVFCDLFERQRPRFEYNQADGIEDRTGA